MFDSIIIDSRNRTGARRAPWYTRGTDVHGAMTSDEALKAGKLDFHVDLAETFWMTKERPGIYLPRSERKVTYRTDTGAALGDVSNDYRVLQNTEAFDFFDHVVGEKLAIYETVGNLHGGKVIWIYAEIPGSVKVIGDDEISRKILLSNGHDGSMAARMGLVPLRPVCENTFRMALAQMQNEFVIVHRGNLQAQVAEAREALGMAKQWYEKAGEAWKVLAATTYKPADLDRYLAALFPLPKQVSAVGEAQDRWLQVQDQILGQRKRVRELTEIGLGTDIKGVKGTLWGLFNAAVEWADYDYRGNEENRVASILFGQRADSKKKAFMLAVDLAKGKELPVAAS